MVLTDTASLVYSECILVSLAANFLCRIENSSGEIYSFDFFPFCLWEMSGEAWELTLCDCAAYVLQALFKCPLLSTGAGEMFLYAYREKCGWRRFMRPFESGHRL